MNRDRRHTRRRAEDRLQVPTTWMVVAHEIKRQAKKADDDSLPEGTRLARVASIAAVAVHLAEMILETDELTVDSTCVDET